MRDERRVAGQDLSARRALAILRSPPLLEVQKIAVASEMDDHRLDAVVVTPRAGLFQQADMVADPSRRLGGPIEVVGCLGRPPREIGELVEFRNQPVDLRLPIEASAAPRRRKVTPLHQGPPSPLQPGRRSATRPFV